MPNSNKEKNFNIFKNKDKLIKEKGNCSKKPKSKPKKKENYKNSNRNKEEKSDKIIKNCNNKLKILCSKKYKPNKPTSLKSKKLDNKKLNKSIMKI